MKAQDEDFIRAAKSVDCVDTLATAPPQKKTNVRSNALRTEVVASA